MLNCLSFVGLRSRCLVWPSFVVLMAALPSGTSVAETGTCPNIVVIMADDI